MNANLSKFAKLATSRVMLAALALVFAWLSLRQHRYVGAFGDLYYHSRDDAMITFRVAAIFQAVGSPFYNIGEAVAASTSLFWPIILSPVYLVFDPQGAVALIVVVSAITVIVTAAISAGVFDNHVIRLFAFWAILISPSVILYGNTGWEHVPQALLLTAAFAHILRASAKAGTTHVPTAAFLIACVSFLVRVDSTAAIVAIGLGWFFTDGRYRQAMTYLVLVSMMMIPAGYLIAMYAWYSDLVPNTAQLKIDGFWHGVQSGIAYNLDFGQSGSFPWLIAISIAIWLFARNRPPGAWIVLLAGLLQVLYVISVGGDVFPSGRFYLAYLPAAVVVFLMLLRRLDAGRLRRTATFVGSGLLIVVSLGDGAASDFASEATGPAEGRTSALGQHLRVVDVLGRHLDPAHGSIGLHYAGMGYHLIGYHIVDFLGKAEPTIARSDPRPGPIGHNKWNYSYALENYDVAAVPMPAFYRDKVLSEDYRRDENRLWLFWEDCVSELEARGYVFVPPDVFDNPSDGFGIYVRPDLVREFIDFRS